MKLLIAPEGTYLDGELIQLDEIIVRLEPYPLEGPKTKDIDIRELIRAWRWRRDRS